MLIAFGCIKLKNVFDKIGGNLIVDIFEELESNVRSYCRSFPVVFNRAKDSKIFSESGKEYIDFLAGAGTLNYGHNNEFIKQKILSYLSIDGIVHGLDMYTIAKREFIEKFSETILKPKGLQYKFQFCGPTGTNAVEAALKIARKVKQRTNVFAFTGGFHGMSLGSLSVTSNMQYRLGAALSLANVTFIPFPHDFFYTFDTIEYIDSILKDSCSGVDKPAAIIFETVQAEGGVNVASIEWMQRLRTLCDSNDILLICDDIQVGCGRTGPFFSFERAGIVPDIVTLSKSIGGFGLPMSLLLLKPELDIWQPGEHTGTFRGNQLAFIGATAALEYREDKNLEQEVKNKELFLRQYLNVEIGSTNKDISVRGIGMIWGIDLSKLCNEREIKRIALQCFERGLIIERVGRNDSVLKILPPLTIEMNVLEDGCSIMRECIIDSIK